MATAMSMKTIFPKEIKRTKTPCCVARAREALKDFLEYGMITQDDFDCTIIKIKNAKHDDEVSAIMHRVNRNLYRMC